MSAALTHVVFVHLPVIGVLFTLVIAIIGAITGDRRMIFTGWIFVVVCAIGAAVAYGSGPPAFEQLKTGFDQETRAIAEQHALVGRAAFLGAVLSGIVALQALLRTAAAEEPSRWLIRGLVGVLLVVAVLLAWAAHLGGSIRHPEARIGQSQVHQGFLG